MFDGAGTLTGIEVEVITPNNFEPPDGGKTWGLNLKLSLHWGDSSAVQNVLTLVDWVEGVPRVGQLLHFEPDRGPQYRFRTSTPDCHHFTPAGTSNQRQADYHLVVAAIEACILAEGLVPGDPLVIT